MPDHAHNHQAPFGLACWQGWPAPMRQAHRHNELELNVVERGSVSYLFGAQQMLLCEGDACLFWAARPHRLIESAGATSVFWVTVPLALFLNWRLPTPFGAALLGGTLAQVHHTAALPDTAPLQRWQRDLDRHDSAYRAIVELELEAYVRRFALEWRVGPLPVARRASPAERMATYIGQHSAEPLSVALIAAEVGLHPHYAMQVFRSFFGISMITYLTQQRVAHAQQLLITGDLNVAEVGLEVGFSSTSRFYAAFKAICGVAPGVYRDSLL
ncbi:MAG: helix-turn-helix domain-containing protein [Roseiflexaceae bacterium]|nr:helix-turn-helix domain-containing protein [Roseiflexaceae bacterium]